MTDLAQLLAASEAFLTELPGGYSAAWRLLSVSEYNALRGMVSAGLLLEPQARLEAVKLCVFDYSSGHELWPAGYLDSLGAAILWYSGDCDPHTLRDDLSALQQVYGGGSPHEHMIKIILCAFPGIRPDEIENWSRNKMLKTFVQAEHVMFYKHAADGFEYLEPDDITYAHEKKDDAPIGVDLQQELAYQKEEGLSGSNFWLADDMMDETEEAAAWGLTAEQLAKLDAR